MKYTLCDPFQGLTGNCQAFLIIKLAQHSLLWGIWQVNEKNLEGDIRK